MRGVSMNINDLFVEIIDYINKHIYEDITIDELSLYFGYEKSYLMKAFKKKIGLPIKGYINNRKIMNVLKELKSDDSLLKIALNNGFNSLEYFSEIFSKEVGVSPSIYRKYLNNTCSEKEREIIDSYFTKLQQFNISLLQYRREVKEAKVLSLSFK
jgi:AraC-like DNA-binding protein